MEDLHSPLILSSFLFLLSLSTAAFLPEISDTFPKCVSTQPTFTPPNSNVFFAPKSPEFIPLLNSTAQNLRLLLPSAPKPQLIFTPLAESHVQAAVVCAKKLRYQLRIRSGGHDYEGLSYSSPLKSPPLYILLDLQKLRDIKVDIPSSTAWAQSGATIGELYYRISQQSKTHAFVAGLYPSLGIGGHITGGAYGGLMRKHGLGVDNVVDARIVDANGRILDRKSMGEDLLWAIRGGGGGSFGVILALKVKLVQVPAIVTGFKVSKTLEQNGTDILLKWQNVASKIDENLFIRVLIRPQNDTKTGKRTIGFTYDALFLGKADDLLRITEKDFPELGLKKNDTVEKSFIDWFIFDNYPPNTPPEVLLKGKATFNSYFKAKSDFIRAPIPKQGLEGLWKLFLEEDSPMTIWNPFGGVLDRIPESATPFPHRKGVLFLAQYLTNWRSDKEDINKHYQWIRKMYNYLSAYAPVNPREAYLNYRDVDLGLNERKQSTSLSEARKWGVKYFKGNFDRLVKVKSKVDPDNFFWHEQSIPVIGKKNM